MKSLGDFFDHLQRRRCGLDDRLDRGSGQEKLGGKFIGLALEFSRPVAPVPDVGLGTNELRQVVIGQQKVSDFMGEREILAASPRIDCRIAIVPKESRALESRRRQTHQRPPRESGVRVAKRLPADRHAERQFAREGVHSAAFLRPVIDRLSGGCDYCVS
jgi:hypothetical protein